MTRMGVQQKNVWRQQSAFGRVTKTRTMPVRFLPEDAAYLKKLMLLRLAGCLFQESDYDAVAANTQLSRLQAQKWAENLRYNVLGGKREDYLRADDNPKVFCVDRIGPKKLDTNPMANPTSNPSKKLTQFGFTDTRQNLPLLLYWLRAVDGHLPNADLPKADQNRRACC